jgi:protein-S-isoprenylcysteine O-methyltransferase Ste14
MRTAGEGGDVPARIARVSGTAVSFGARGLYWYTLFVGIAFHVRVVMAEEPWLRRTHDAAWDDYVRRVRRWL